MLYIRMTLLCVVATLLSAIVSEKQLAIADEPTLPLFQSPFSLSNGMGLGPFDDDDTVLQKRDFSFGSFSRGRIKDNLYQWTFGNATNKVNISISTCTQLDDVAGVYQFTDGITKNNATIREMVVDFGMGTSSGFPERYAIQMIKTVELAYNESQELLQDIICNDTSLALSNPGRQLLHFNGRVASIVIGASGLAVIMVSGFELTSSVLGRTVFIVLFAYVYTELIAWCRDAGRLNGFEVWMGAKLSAVGRWLNLLARQAFDAAGQCFSAADVANAVNNLLQGWGNPQEAAQGIPQGWQGDGQAAQGAAQDVAQGAQAAVQGAAQGVQGAGQEAQGVAQGVCPQVSPV